MTASIDGMVRLNARDHAALLVAVLCGDALMNSDTGDVWLTPERVARGEHGLMFAYASAHGALRLYAALPDDLDAEWVAKERERLSPLGAETRWAHFVAHLGRFDRVGDGAAIWSETTLTHDGKTWRTRRERHPSAVIDRLLMRDRAEAEERLQWLIGEQLKRDVGQTPLANPRANVGDKRSE